MEYSTYDHLGSFIFSNKFGKMLIANIGMLHTQDSLVVFSLFLQV